MVMTWELRRHTMLLSWWWYESNDVTQCCCNPSFTPSIDKQPPSLWWCNTQICAPDVIRYSDFCCSTQVYDTGKLEKLKLILRQIKPTYGSINNSLYIILYVIICYKAVSVLSRGSLSSKISVTGLASPATWYYCLKQALSCHVPVKYSWQTNMGDHEVGVRN